VPSDNPKLKIFVHSGFDHDAFLVFQDMLPCLDKSKTLVLTGHSLGAAISTLIMMYLYEEQFELGLSINFGQPKVTNRQGTEVYKSLPLLRVADENDVVPLLPPITLLDSIHGEYAHLGPELILLKNQYYVYQDQALQRKLPTDSFWENLAEISVKQHFIVNYLNNIHAKLSKAQQVPYALRERYIQP